MLKFQFMVDLFSFYFYENIDKNEPRDDPWRLDLGKIVVPNVFADRELIDL